MPFFIAADLIYVSKEKRNYNSIVNIYSHIVYTYHTDIIMFTFIIYVCVLPPCYVFTIKKSLWRNLQIMKSELLIGITLLAKEIKTRDKSRPYFFRSIMMTFNTQNLLLQPLYLLYLLLAVYH
jgi:uncharacterized protein YktB (UPF0637 family)